MARSDLILTLVRAGTSGDRKLFDKTVESLAAEARGKQHFVVAEQLEKFLLHRSSQNGHDQNLTPRNHSQPSDLFYEIVPHRRLSDLVLPKLAEQACVELVEEHNRRDLLRSHNLEPRHRVLLIGPPGNGKTSLAEAIAAELVVPLFVVRYDGVIGSFLGETASRLRKVFDHVRTRPCILFLDEFDTLGKERGDTHDTGEVKRVVSSLLLQIDSLPSHVVVVTATNHAELLDRAVWRRFQLHLKLPKPSAAQVKVYLNRLEARYAIQFVTAVRDLPAKLSNGSFAEIEGFAMDVVRRSALAGPNPNIKKITADQLRLWQGRMNI